MDIKPKKKKKKEEATLEEKSQEKEEPVDKEIKTDTDIVVEEKVMETVTDVDNDNIVNDQNETVPLVTSDPQNGGVETLVDVKETVQAEVKTDKKLKKKKKSKKD